jgi:fatty acid desaturase
LGLSGVHGEPTGFVIYTVTTVMNTSMWNEHNLTEVVGLPQDEPGLSADAIFSFAPYPVWLLLGAGVCSSLFFQAPWTQLTARLRHVVGFMLAIDFLIFWAVPLVGQGALYKQLLLPYVRPLFNYFDESPALRRFAKAFIYEKETHADFFFTQLLFLMNFIPTFCFVVYWQVRYGSLPWWLIAVYYCNWVGLGGRNLGASYAMAHREGHNTRLYKPWIRNTLGNVFENWLGLFFGGVPNNFSTTHISLHHRLDAAAGDTLYTWDIDRSAWPEFLMYVARGLVHMTGFGALQQFSTSPRKYDHEHNLPKLQRGVFVYWVLLPAAVQLLVGSPSFYFWIVLQPLVCMTFFLSLINMGFHSFIESDAQGQRIQCVESVAMLGGDDDYWGEDDHMAHHYHTYVYHRDLPAHHRAQRQQWAQQHASVFQGTDIMSLSMFVLLKAWPLLAARFVDYSGKLTREQIEQMLMQRAQRRDRQHECLLYDVPPCRPTHYGNPPAQSKGKAPCPQWLLDKLAAFQLGLASLIEQGLPPILPLEHWIGKAEQKVE